MYVRSSALTLVAAVAISCTPIAKDPPPIVFPSPAATVPVGVATALPRIKESELPFPAVAGPVVLFQLSSETVLRAISFGGDVNGVLRTPVGLVSGGAAWAQSPYGAPYIVDTTVYDRDGE